MSFKFQGSGHVWDPERNCLLCSFVKGEVEVETEREAEVLRKSGFLEIVQSGYAVMEEPVVPSPLTETDQHANLRLDPYVPKAPRASKGVPK